MTIAACYVSPEGIVLGADSTSTWGNPGESHYYNHGQKVFEIGENGTLGIITWGLGGLTVSSHRMLIALLADDLQENPPQSVREVADRWADRFWTAYVNSPVGPLIQRCRDLDAKTPFNPSAARENARTQEEEGVYAQLRYGLVTGFCIGGYIPSNRTPEAFTTIFDPLLDKPEPAQVTGAWGFWGAPNIIQRLMFGCDSDLKASIERSDLWTGTRADLDTLLAPHVLAHPVVPIRDAIDFVHSCIHCTIKAMKFSSLAPICGGPIEIAVITADRRFRWVRHKEWDAAIMEGALWRPILQVDP